MTKRIICMLLAVIMLFGCIGVLSACKDDTPKECVHVDEDKDNLCDSCGEKMKENVRCNHKDTNNDGKCDKCGADLGTDEVIEYPWDNQELLFMLTKNSNNKELSSTCDRYLAGEWDKDTDDLDLLIGERNAAAELETKVTVKYDYYDESEAYNWSYAAMKIVEEISSNSGTIPDMYCNFVYDIVAASLNGCFANVMSATKPGSTNYFTFNREDYIEEGKRFPDPENDKGYMYEFMRSSTLSNIQMYLIASDYLIDLVRSFYIVPVNKALLEEVGDKVTGDRDGSGRFDIEDFYLAVKNNEWTYDLVAEYAARIQTQAGAELTLKDRIGFALPRHGLTACGILYSTNIEIVGRVPNDKPNGFDYYYPDENPDLIEMASNLSTLMKKPGVLCVDTGYEQYGGSTLLATRERFCENMVLFGGIECVGALEELEYQELKTGTGFGVVPVPLYKPVEPGDDTTYLTSVHAIGKPLAISRTTNAVEFSACTAFIDYQSTHSSEILDIYYESKLQYTATDGTKGTVDMLNFIRDNVRSSFDKITEDAIGYKYDSTGDRWHSIMVTGNYQIEMSGPYAELIDAKKSSLSKLQASYDNYPK